MQLDWLMWLYRYGINVGMQARSHLASEGSVRVPMGEFMGDVVPRVANSACPITGHSSSPVVSQELSA